jgi:hypothetical protein
VPSDSVFAGTLAAVKIPFANTKPKSGRGATEPGLHAEFRILYPNGNEAMGWTQARWDEAKQQHEREPGASLTASEVRTIRLDPNGLKHYMETVVQVAGHPPEGQPRVLSPWTQGGMRAVGFIAPLIVEVRWEGIETPQGSRRMQVEASEHPNLNPEGKWID